MLVGFLATCKMFTQHTHTHSLTTSTWLRLAEKTSPTKFHGEKWRIAVVAVAVAVAVSDDVSVASRSNVALLHCYFILFCPPFAAAAAATAPPLTNLQRLTYLTCWHALNRMSDEGRHCSKARNTLRQFAAAKRADDGEWRRMTVGT